MNTPNLSAVSIDHLQVPEGVKPFGQTLINHHLTLKREITKTLQVNVCLTCNQTCAHCHLEAGPGRKEMMSKKTMDQVAAFADQNKFETIDITGGAPELHPGLVEFIKKLTPLTEKMILRSNLSVLGQKGLPLMSALKENGVNIVASFPSLNEAQSNTVRGTGIFQSSLNALKELNMLGYGLPHSGLALDVVTNPSGAFLSPSQESLENRFKLTMKRKWGIDFNRLYSFANVPLGRFRSWLIQSGNYEKYLLKLVSAFNPEALCGVMCKTLLSISWDGYVYDCDFNQAAGLYTGNRETQLSDMDGPPPSGTPITTGDHCYTCTAGTGFT